MQRARTWIVGMDLSERSRGAIAFARWLHNRSAADERMRGVYVGDAATIERDHPGAGLPLDRARQAIRLTAQTCGAADVFEAFDAIPGDAPEDELRRIASARGVDGLIVGRSGTTDGWSLVSLGRVARRLLRHVPRPIAVVPPDLDPDELGDGPVVVGVVPEDHCVAAGRIGRELAESLGLPILLVHVLPDPARFPLAASDPSFAYANVLVSVEADDDEAADRLRTWLDDNGLGDLPLRTEPGVRGRTLLDVAESVDASLVVCGSRRLSLSERIFQSSTGSDLAAHAQRPVLVVPPDADDEHEHRTATPILRR
jgi:nucleotide-binding universal stress UspA family protein